jgi:hypothetical protein
VATLSATALSLLQAFAASLMVLIWNFGEATLVLASCGGPVLGRRPPV